VFTVTAAAAEMTNTMVAWLTPTSDTLTAIWLGSITSDKTARKMTFSTSWANTLALVIPIYISSKQSNIVGHCR
jgi:hypothetical protein